MQESMPAGTAPGPQAIEVRGARVHNLKNLDLKIPLNRLVAIAGVSGSGKSSLALGVLYAEGSRRYLEALSAYTRRRLPQTNRPDLDDIENVPAALTLHQRPAVPGIRSTFGTVTELLNSLRLLFSRIGSHCCPQGHRVPPSANVARGRQLVCPVCGTSFDGPSAESFSFNSGGACARCSGTGLIRDVDDSKLVSDPSLTLRDGAVEPWNMFGIQWMYLVAGELGVRTDVPFSELTPAEKHIVYAGPAIQKMTPIRTGNGKLFDLNCTYRNAHETVVEALRKTVTEKGLARINRYLSVGPCPVCHGDRLNDRARSTLLAGRTLSEVCALTLDEAVAWVRTLPAQQPAELRSMTENIAAEFLGNAARLQALGLGYLTLDRAGSTLSTGERQRVQLARAVRNRTTGVLYVLDEPSIGLHPANVDGLLKVVRDLVDHGNSVVVVDHDIRVLRAADWLIEMGPGAGDSGGRVLTQGPAATIERDPASLIGPYLAGTAPLTIRPAVPAITMFARGHLHLTTAPLHTVQALDLDLPQNRLIAVTGVSGAGKTTLVLESLVPALVAQIAGRPLPAPALTLAADGLRRVVLVDATPIGANVRSTVATYSGILDDLRRLYAATPAAKQQRHAAGDFSYNTGALRCPNCDGTGTISLDVQFLPDVDIPCPDCSGSRYSPAAAGIKYTPKGAADGLSLPALLALTVDQALPEMQNVKKVRTRLQVLQDLGLGYLTLGESTPALSGGEAQRLKLAAEMNREQDGTVFVFDEPTIGLHPLDVRTLIKVFQRLLDRGSTVIVIDHDLDLIRNADYIIDMGPGGGTTGGRIVAAGTPAAVSANPASVTGRYLNLRARKPAHF
ncbi:MAG: excinuclease ABC subunit UvrA [Candidatus Methanomethylophilus sp.]|nr:excinuclease ABC subunit UvrA [Methanomethylophilus sp.]